MTGDQQVEKFASDGRVTGVIGLVVAACIVGFGISDPGSIPLPVVAGTLVVAVLMWATMLRPQVSVADGDLVMRNMLETIRIPLAAIDELAVRQVLAVRAGDRRFVSPGVGRSVRQAVKASRADRPGPTAPALGPALGGGSPSDIEPGIPYADFVEHRLRDLVQVDRNRRGIRAYSEEAEALAGEVRREPAFLEIAALAASTAFLILAILL